MHFNISSFCSLRPFATAVSAPETALQKMQVSSLAGPETEPFSD